MFFGEIAYEIPLHVRGDVDVDSVVIVWHGHVPAFRGRGTVLLICLHVLCS